MGDLLSASSLLLTITTVLYSLWYSEIKDALDTEIPDFEADYKKPFLQVRKAFWTKSIPLSCATSLLALIFLPDLIKLVVLSFFAYRDDFGRALFNYDSVATTFSAVTMSLIVFAVVMVRQSFKLYSLKNDLDASD